LFEPFYVYSADICSNLYIKVPGRTYWQNSTYSGVDNFIRGIKDGKIEPRQQQPRQKNPFEEFADTFVNYLPWSLIGLLALIGGTFYLFLPSGNTVMRPPPPPATASSNIKDPSEESPSASYKKDQ
jgi:hypothetical protein